MHVPEHEGPVTIELPPASPWNQDDGHKKNYLNHTLQTEKERVKQKRKSSSMRYGEKKELDF